MKNYEKPEVEVIALIAHESITDDDDYMDGDQIVESSEF